MKALTICQPYAHLIVAGQKRVENRTWATRYRGPLLIHAGKSRAWLDLVPDPAEPLLDIRARDARYGVALGDMEFGAVVGVANLVDVLHIGTIKRGDHDAQHPWLRDHVHASGLWCWLLEDVRRFDTPVPRKGAQGLFELPTDQGGQLEEQLLILSLGT